MKMYSGKWREQLVFTTDILITAFCYVNAFFIRFDGVPDKKYLVLMIRVLPLVLILRTIALIYFKLHKSIWEYASIKDLIQILKAVTLSSIFIVAVVMILQIGHPRSIFIIDWLLLIIGLSGMRLAIRVTRPLRWRMRNGDSHHRKVLIVGAGDAGEMILREMIYRYNHNYEVVGLIDDNPQKYRKQIHGITVLGTKKNIPDIVKKRDIEEIVIAIPSATSDEMREIVNYCIKSGARYRTVPNISNVMDGTVKVKELREVRLEDLLKRDETFLKREKMESYIKGKNVLITGAGGSIGSELCRQIARLSPRELILFEKSENVLFYIDMELGQFFQGVNKIPIVGDICDRKRVKEVLTAYKPQIIIHAAAHKHVPLMELNSMEAIKNNVFGTKVIAEEAIACGAERFIMLSTDKAVEPSSLMGVSKKIAEMYLSSLDKTNGTKFIIVRFGNVLGSEGSVIPTFKKQIEKGGPITITHPDIKRYFMTIPEAAALVLEAGFMADGGEIFILEMGSQIKIVDIAKELIRLSGLTPNQDIEIVFTGLRPGEKMFEALFAADEELIKTKHEKIFAIKSVKENKRNILSDIQALKEIVDKADMRLLLEKLKETVPTYTPSQEALKMPQEKKTQEKRKDILIVDDDEVIRSLLHKFLEGRGYKTLLTSSGKKALELVKNNGVSVALVDIRMPGFMDGFKTLQYLKKINKNIEVILITGFGTDRTKKLSQRLGAFAYLEKPFDLLEVKNHIEKILRLNKSEGFLKGNFSKNKLTHRVIAIQETIGQKTIKTKDLNPELDSESETGR